jgi:hypothetical protein
MSQEDLATSADLIILGTCTGVESEYRDGELWTEATVDVTQSLKGATSGEALVMVPGGIDLRGPHPVARAYPGAPQLRPNEEVVLFLEEMPGQPDRYAISGFSQGYFTVVSSPAGAQAVRNLSAVRVVTGQGIQQGSVQSVSLDRFLAEISGYLENAQR